MEAVIWWHGGLRVKKDKGVGRGKSQTKKDVFQFGFRVGNSKIHH